MKTKPMQNKQNLGKSTDEISLCLSCYCATKTIKGKCGKCKADKPLDKPDTGTDWEIEFDRKHTIIVSYEKWPDETEPQKLSEPNYIWNDITKNNPKAVKNSIRTLLAQKQAEHNSNITYLIDQTKNEIKQLKQQHREELESLKMERRSAIEMKCISDNPQEKLAELVLLKEGFNQAVNQFNKKLDQMLQDSDK